MLLRTISFTCTNCHCTISGPTSHIENITVCPICNLSNKPQKPQKRGKFKERLKIALEMYDMMYNSHGQYSAKHIANRHGCSVATVYIMLKEAEEHINNMK